MSDIKTVIGALAHRLEMADTLRDGQPEEVLAEILVNEPNLRLEIGLDDGDSVWLLMDRASCLVSGSLERCAWRALSYYVRPK